MADVCPWCKKPDCDAWFCEPITKEALAECCGRTAARADKAEADLAGYNPRVKMPQAGKLVLVQRHGEPIRTELWSPFWDWRHEGVSTTEPPERWWPYPLDPA